MREPPETTTVKAPLSLTNLSDKLAVYFANSKATCSSESNILTLGESFWDDFTSAIDDFALNFEESFGIAETWFNLRVKFEALVKEICGFLREIRGDWFVVVENLVVGVAWEREWNEDAILSLICWGVFTY